MADVAPTRRIGAVHLPDLLCELVADGQDPKSPFAVAFCQKEAERGKEAELSHVLSAANEAARRFGVRAGQTVVEARSLVASLVVHGITTAKVRRALGRVAEVLLAFGTTASIDPGFPFLPHDTVWIDLTGTAHLRGGEEAALLEMTARVRELGHRVRAAIADGPHLGRAVAAFATSPETIVPAGGAADTMETLPLEALPLSPAHLSWLHRLGLFTVGDVTALPHATLAGRLGERWRETLELAKGHDSAPLVAYEPPGAPTEDIEWEEGATSIEPLLFALSGLSSRLSARLEGRGEAARALELFAPYDRSIAELRRVTSVHEGRAGIHFRIDLPTPLAHKTELYRVLKSKLERTVLGAPVLGLSITASLLTEAPKTQLLLNGDPAIDADPRSMAVLLAELSSEIGPDNVGVLELSCVHRPEARTVLAPIDDVSSFRKRPPPRRIASDVEFPTRLLPKPVPIEPMPGGELTVSIDNQLFTVRGTRPMMRLDQIEWWTSSPVCRDYARVWLSSGKKNFEGWIFTDRLTGRTYLHGYYD
jgi:protein ImuB